MRDRALWFYYEENLEALRRAGAELVRLSLLDDAAWPELDGLYLGGGFPEDWARELSASPHLARLGTLVARGLPIYAECGGFMVLASALERDGQRWPMSGIFPVETRFCPKPQGLGYVRADVVLPNPYFPRPLSCADMSSTTPSATSLPPSAAVWIMPCACARARAWAAMPRATAGMVW